MTQRPPAGHALSGRARSLSDLRHTPWLLIVQKILRRVPLRPMDAGKLCFLRLDGAPRIPPGMLRGAGTVRRGTAADIEGLVALRDQRAVFLERFTQEDECVVAEVDGRLVGYEWFCDRAFHQETGWGYRITIPPGFVYAYDAYIDPEHRNTGIWLKFKAYFADLMNTAGKHGVLTFIDYGNAPSLRTHLRFGFKPDGEVLALKIFGHLITFPVRAGPERKSAPTRSSRFAPNPRLARVNDPTTK